MRTCKTIVALATLATGALPSDRFPREGYIGGKQFGTIVLHVVLSIMRWPDAPVDHPTTPPSTHRWPRRRRRRCKYL